MKKVGIITFHNAYNCGSMLESYAIFNSVKKRCKNTEIINFSNKGQLNVYKVFFDNNSVKNVLKNIMLLPFSKRLKMNNTNYNNFKNKYFTLSSEINDNKDLKDNDYTHIVAGSDQIWNITIADGDDAYFLYWVNNAIKIAYAPSFGARNIKKYSKEYKKYGNWISDFDYLSVREKNGQKWIKELTGKNADLIIDPTLLLSSNDYDNILDDTFTPNYNYIFFYCPSFDRKICEFVKKISKKYNMPVICWSTKSYATKRVYTYGFKLVKEESPSIYLSLIKNASLIFTTSFHGAIFSTIYNKKFYVLKNGGMYKEDDRVITLLNQLQMNDRLIEYNFDSSFNYLNEIDYNNYYKVLKQLQNVANKFLDESLNSANEKRK